MLAFYCSRACPGSIIFSALDAARALCGSSWTIISGFQSPVERECLAVFIRAEQPVVICPARSAVGLRVPRAWKLAQAAGRLAIQSSFPKTVRRSTSATAEQRNREIAQLVDAILIAHAAPGGALERLCAGVAADRLYTLDDPANQNLFPIAVPVSPTQLPAILTGQTRGK